jgi:hypothetical protein
MLFTACSILVADWIRSQYQNAAKTSKSFLLVNAGQTLCNRPYNLQGKSIMDLKSDDVKSDYIEKLDTTTAPSIAESTTETASNETTTLVDFSKVI